MFANIGGLTFAWALGAIKATAGAFRWGYIAPSALCVIGIGLTVVLARMRSAALAAPARAAR